MKDYRIYFFYVFWGALSVVFNIACFKFLLFCELDYRVANLITLILLKFFVFFTNKFFVFKTRNANFAGTVLEFGRFLGARLATNLLDFFGLILLVDIFLQDAFYSKIFLAVLVIVSNFVLSKKYVFR
jgi:putative flippase GtrA